MARVAPEYSQEAWDEGIQGRVILSVDVDPDGALRNITVSHSLGYGLDEKAIECVRQWRFSPATENGRPVKSTTSLDILFSLPDERPARPSVGRVARPVPPPPSSLPVVELKPPNESDDFFYVVATNFKAPAVCEQIRPLVDGGGGGASERGYQIESLRSACYVNLATLRHDATLCDRVVPVRTDAFDGSKFDSAYCLTQLEGAGTVAVPSSIEPFVRLMKKLGYDDRRIAASRTPIVKPTPDDYWTFLVALSVYGSPRDRDEFLRRVMGLQ